MISTKIIELRKAKGWTQQELADKTGIPRPMISRYEIYTRPGGVNMKKILKAFGLPANYFFNIAVKNEPATPNILISKIVEDLSHLQIDDQEIIYTMIQIFKKRNNKPKKRRVK